MKFRSVAAGVIAGLLIVEAAFRIRPEASEEMAAKMIAVAIAKQCPDRPEVMRVAMRGALARSLIDPTSLPPWHVVIAAQRMNPSAAGNPFAESMCDEVLAQSF